MKTKVFFTAFLLLLLFSCKKEKTKLDDPHQGKITITADESFKNIAEALTQRYMALYPEARLDLVIQKEDLGFLALLDRKARVALLSRELSVEEKAAFKDKIGGDMIPAPFAADAVVFIVSKVSRRTSISMDEMLKELSADTRRLIFDGTNSSNLNFVAQKLNKKPSDLKFAVINGNEKVLEEINKHPENIGVISLNTFSRPYDAKSENMRNSVKILSVVTPSGSFLPERENIKNMSYPFSRILYFATNESYYGLGNGFMRFCSQQLGQIIVSKEGLQPYNIFDREVKMQ